MLTYVTKDIGPEEELSAAKMQTLHHFAEIGRWSASLLHEISNPLTAAMLHLEMSDQRAPAVRQARRDIQMLRRYVEAARQQVRHKGKATGFYVQPQLDQLKRIVIPLAKRAGVRLIFTPAAHVKLFGDPVKFQQVLANLIVNAIEAYADEDKASQFLLVRVSLEASPEWLTVQVSDWGKGLDASELSQSFEPFYTTKDQVGHSLGIGLALVKQYVTGDFCGSIKVRSSRRSGTCFTIKLPVLAPEA